MTRARGPYYCCRARESQFPGHCNAFVALSCQPCVPAPARIRPRAPGPARTEGVRSRVSNVARRRAAPTGRGQISNVYCRTIAKKTVRLGSDLESLISTVADSARSDENSRSDPQREPAWGHDATLSAGTDLEKA